MVLPVTTLSTRKASYPVAQQPPLAASWGSVLAYGSTLLAGLWRHAEETAGVPLCDLLSDASIMLQSRAWLICRERTCCARWTRASARHGPSCPPSRCAVIGLMRLHNDGLAAARGCLLWQLEQLQGASGAQ